MQDLYTSFVQSSLQSTGLLAHREFDVVVRSAAAVHVSGSRCCKCCQFIAFKVIENVLHSYSFPYSFCETKESHAAAVRKPELQLANGLVIWRQSLNAADKTHCFAFTRSSYVIGLLGCRRETVFLPVPVQYR
jgi:hypothetical protein